MIETMRVSQAEKEKTYQRIVDGASRLLRDRGIESISVGDVMGEAGLTNGGFYRHFETREEMLLAALESALEECTSALEKRFETEEPSLAAEKYRADYLSEFHVQSRAWGCPIAALAGDVARASITLKNAFGKALKRTIIALEQGMRGPKQEKHDRAIREFAMLVGGVMLARASDPETAHRVLAACVGKAKVKEA